MARSSKHTGANRLRHRLSVRPGRRAVVDTSINMFSSRSLHSMPRHRALGLVHPQDRHKRRPVTNQLLRETEVEIDPSALNCCGGSCRGLSATRERDPPAARRTQTARLVDSSRNALGQSRPAAGWKQQRSILLRSTSIPYKSLSSRAIRLDTQSRIQTCSWLHRSERSLDRTSTERSRVRRSTYRCVDGSQPRCISVRTR